jgi:hypothetical protein
MVRSNPLSEFSEDLAKRLNPRKFYLPTRGEITSSGPFFMELADGADNPVLVIIA